jgi:hypothetical protein
MWISAAARLQRSARPAGASAPALAARRDRRTGLAVRQKV